MENLKTDRIKTDRILLGPRADVLKSTWTPDGQTLLAMDG